MFSVYPNHPGSLLEIQIPSPSMEIPSQQVTGSTQAHVSPPVHGSVWVESSAHAWKNASLEVNQGLPQQLLKRRGI